MNTKDLAYFKALVEKRNYTAVAEAFNVSQPTVTQAVKRLEREFEDELVHVDRTHNRTEITRSGQLLYEKASTITANLNLAHQEIENAKLSRIRFTADYRLNILSVTGWSAVKGWPLTTPRRGGNGVGRFT